SPPAKRSVGFCPFAAMRPHVKREGIGSGKSRTNLLCVLTAPDKGMRSQAGAAIYRRGSQPAANGTRSARLAGPHCSPPEDSPPVTPFGSLEAGFGMPVAQATAR